MQTKASAPALKASLSASGRALRTITLGEQPSPRRANNKAAAGRPGSSQSSSTRSGLNSLTCVPSPSTSALSRTMTPPGSCLSRVCSAERTRASLSATRMRVCVFPPTRHLPFTDLSPAKAERVWHCQTRQLPLGSLRAFRQASKTGSPRSKDPQGRRDQYSIGLHHAHQPFVQSFACTNVQVAPCTNVQICLHIRSGQLHRPSATLMADLGGALQRHVAKAPFSGTKNRPLTRIGPGADATNPFRTQMARPSSDGASCMRIATPSADPVRTNSQPCSEQYPRASLSSERSSGSRTISQRTMSR